MSFLDSQGEAADQAGPPSTPASPAPAPGAPPGGGPILAALANQQRPGPRVSAPGPGDQANSMTLLMQAVGLIQHALPGLQPGTPMHQDALRAVTRLSRHVPAGAGQPSAGVQRTQLQDLLQNLLKNALLSRIMTQQRPQGGAGPEGGPPGGGGPGGPAPMPSTPLPGA
jgi:hypothetical protein